MARKLHFDGPATRLVHRALGRLVRGWGHPDDFTEAEAAIAALYHWLGQTPSGHGLTSERDSDHAARAALGVRVSVQDGALVIRVPKRRLKLPEEDR